jgi:hypothetical protein
MLLLLLVPIRVTRLVISCVLASNLKTLGDSWVANHTICHFDIYNPTDPAHPHTPQTNSHVKMHRPPLLP